MTETRTPLPRPVPSTVLERPVAGQGIAPKTSLGEVLDGDLTLLVFLRHHG